MSGYGAVLFDLFGTLVGFDTAALPETVVDGRPVRSTSDAWHDLVASALPGTSVADVLRAVVAASAELDAVRRADGVEFPSRERFRRALGRLGCTDSTAAELAPELARAHLRRLASITRFSAAHARVLERAGARAALGVITNFDDTTTAFDVLARHAILPRLATVVVSEAVGRRKPDAMLVRLALRELGASADQAVLIGDHPREDVGAATAAGVDAVWIDAAGVGVAPGDPVPRYVVRSLPEAAALLG